MIFMFNIKIIIVKQITRKYTRTACKEGKLTPSLPLPPKKKCNIKTKTQKLLII